MAKLTNTKVRSNFLTCVANGDMAGASNLASHLWAHGTIESERLAIGAVMQELQHNGADSALKLAHRLDGTFPACKNSQGGRGWVFPDGRNRKVKADLTASWNEIESVVARDGQTINTFTNLSEQPWDTPAIPREQVAAMTPAPQSKTAWRELPTSTMPPVKSSALDVANDTFTFNCNGRTFANVVGAIPLTRAMPRSGTLVVFKSGEYGHVAKDGEYTKLGNQW